MSVLVMSEQDWNAVRTGAKTLHLFPPRKGEELIEYRAIYTRKNEQWHLKFEAGQLRAVQTRTGGGAVGVVRIQRIEYVPDVRKLSEERVRAAGYASLNEFLLRWAQLHARSTHTRFVRWRLRNQVTETGALEGGWHVIYTQSTAPADRWDAWALTVDLLTSTPGEASE